MAKKKTAEKRASYKSLFEWRIANGMPDEWFVAVGGNQANEVYTLDQVRQMHASSPESRIQVLNSANAEDADAKWIVFREVNKKDKAAEKSAKETVGCAYTAAVLIPIVGLLMGLFMLGNEKTRNKAAGVILLSVFMGIFAWFMFMILAAE